MKNMKGGKDFVTYQEQRLHSIHVNRRERDEEAGGKDIKSCQDPRLTLAYFVVTATRHSYY
jgi:hypothetical protein